MSFRAPLPHHGVLFCLLVLPITAPLAGAQKPSAAPADNTDFGFSPSAAMLGLLIAVVSFFIAVYSVYILHCSRIVAAGAGAGSFRPRRATPRGLDAAVIDTFPTLVYSDVKGLRLGKGALECVVCLSEFEDHETLLLIPKCHHAFHPDCIEEWLRHHTTCPVCRAELAPQPGELTDPVIPPVATAAGDESIIQVVVQENANTDVEQGREIERQEPADANKTPNQSGGRELGSFRTRRFPRSHSTGHSLVQPVQDTERFTLRLPVEVRKQVMDRAANMAGSSRRGNRSSTGEGSSRYLRRLDQAFKSDRWVFTRMPSFRTRSSPLALPRVPSNSDEGGSIRHLSRTKESSTEPPRPPV
ncbi:E3 ubiquitin-protein ligase ATL6-like [Punica granatum]|uniref:E3 ubiquitin-protein ligase ATL6-like n=2 Tax=Punica granatum TaxID=22663 RepID=A0A6P8C7F4_PUNGR|nr:E3 ubiquitin-protein ligase ATL6-like [Punica granatum]XP_031377093.1 E3 ubiquitin-protein ligase ATL6-like [Punica granatum]PKI74090.1 hypothetical protein CRG98_005568 [Punica granatum]